jgi:hypothetical protein
LRQCGGADARRLPHDHEAGALEVRDYPLGGDGRHDVVGVVQALATAEAQRARFR